MCVRVERCQLRPKQLNHNQDMNPWATCLEPLLTLKPLITPLGISGQHQWLFIADQSFCSDSPSIPCVNTSAYACLPKVGTTNSIIITMTRIFFAFVSCCLFSSPLPVPPPFLLLPSVYISPIVFAVPPVNTDHSLHPSIIHQLNPTPSLRLSFLLSICIIIDLSLFHYVANFLSGVLRNEHDAFKCMLTVFNTENIHGRGWE